MNNKIKDILNEILGFLRLLGYFPKVSANDCEYDISFYVESGENTFLVRHKNAIRMLSGGYLLDFRYSDCTQHITLSKENIWLDPDNDRYSELYGIISDISDDNNKEIFINQGNHFERITF